PRVHLKQASNELIAYGLVGIDLTLRLSSLNAATSSNVTSTASPVTSTASPTSSTHPMSAAPSRRSFTRSSAAIHLLPDVFREEECRCRNAETSSRPPLRIARVPATSRSQEMSHGPLVAERPGCRRANGVAPKGSEAEKPPCGVPKGTAILKGHTGYVIGCALSPDGKRIVTASWDRAARIRDAETGALLTTLRGHTSGVGHTNYVLSCSFSPECERLVTGSYDETARVWDAETGALQVTLVGHTYVASCAFSPDGERIVTASRDRTAWLWGTPRRARC
ncbi:WD40-repeat-containing domain protein, partial [Pelagophyceae sp. CCMP2097]